MPDTVIFYSMWLKLKIGKVPVNFFGTLICTQIHSTLKSLWEQERNPSQLLSFLPICQLCIHSVRLITSHSLARALKFGMRGKCSLGETLSWGPGDRANGSFSSCPLLGIRMSHHQRKLSRALGAQSLNWFFPPLQIFWLSQNWPALRKIVMPLCWFRHILPQMSWLWWKKVSNYALISPSHRYLANGDGLAWTLVEIDALCTLLFYTNALTLVYLCLCSLCPNQSVVEKLSKLGTQRLYYVSLPVPNVEQV